MKIKYVPPSPKAGTTEHLQPHRAQALVDSGFAEFVPPAQRGTNEWLKEMAEQEAQRVAGLPKVGTGWAIKETMAAPYSGAPRVVVVKTTPHETLYFDAPPADAPPQIVQRWKDALATDAALFTARGEFLQQQAREPRRTNGYSEFDLLRVKK